MIKKNTCNGHDTGMTNEDLTKDIADDVASKSEDIAGTLKGVDSEGRGHGWRSKSENIAASRAWTRLEIEVGELRWSSEGRGRD